MIPPLHGLAQLPRTPLLGRWVNKVDSARIHREFTALCSDTKLVQNVTEQAGVRSRAPNAERRTQGSRTWLPPTATSWMAWTSWPKGLLPAPSLGGGPS